MGDQILDDAAFADALAKQINSQLDLPYLSEETELRAIRWVTGLLAKFVPNSVRQLCVDASDGISEKEIERLEGVLVNVIKMFTDVPGVPAIVEDVAIRAIVHACMEFVKTGKSLE